MQKDAIKIDVNSIPDYVRDDLAAATLEFTKRLLTQFGGSEMLHAKATEIEKSRGGRQNP